MAPMSNQIIKKERALTAHNKYGGKSLNTGYYNNSSFNQIGNAGTSNKTHTLQ